MDTTGKIYIAISIAAIVGMIVAFWFISKKCAKGVLLGVGVALWIAGQAISSVQVREMKLIGGICTLSGFIGGLLGLMDLFRKRKAAPSAAPAVGTGAEPPQLPPQ